ncbi:hypothetical protein HSX11_29930 [Oxalobacteraceae bacterium]|nr:hypothetical protein [Oxalobacteraceae bacterium]
MLQPIEIQRRCQHIARAIGQAAQACSAETNVPGELRNCIQRLDDKSDFARTLLGMRDPQRIRKVVEEMEQLGDRARRICSSGVDLTPQMRGAVVRLHEQLAELKMQMH